MKHTIPMYAINEEMKNNVFFILDGDKECQRENPDDYTINQRNDIEFLEEKVKAIYSGNLPKAFPDSGPNGGDEQQKCEIYLQYISYHYSNVSYLPNNKIPEQIVLESKYVNDRYNEIINNYTEPDVKKYKNILWDIKKDREDGDINDTFESLSQELFHEHKTAPIEDISLISELLTSIFENGHVLLKPFVRLR